MARTERRVYCHKNYIFDQYKYQTPQGNVGMARKIHLECEFFEVLDAFLYVSG